jgi:hypothetical protein
VTAPLPHIKLGFGGGRGFARFMGGWVTLSDPATIGTSAGSARRHHPGTLVGDNCGPPIGRKLAGGPESAIPAGRPRTNVGGLQHGFLTSGGPT